MTLDQKEDEKLSQITERVRKISSRKERIKHYEEILLSKPPIDTCTLKIWIDYIDALDGVKTTPERINIYKGLIDNYIDYEEFWWAFFDIYQLNILKYKPRIKDKKVLDFFISLEKGIYSEEKKTKSKDVQNDNFVLFNLEQNENIEINNNIKNCVEIQEKDVIKKETLNDIGMINAYKQNNEIDKSTNKVVFNAQKKVFNFSKKHDLLTMHTNTNIKNNIFFCDKNKNTTDSIFRTKYKNYNIDDENKNILSCDKEHKKTITNFANKQVFSGDNTKKQFLNSFKGDFIDEKNNLHLYGKINSEISKKGITDYQSLMLRQKRSDYNKNAMSNIFNKNISDYNNMYESQNEKCISGNDEKTIYKNNIYKFNSDNLKQENNASSEKCSNIYNTDSSIILKCKEKVKVKDNVCNKQEKTMSSFKKNSNVEVVQEHKKNFIDNENYGKQNLKCLSNENAMYQLATKNNKKITNLIHKTSVLDESNMHDSISITLNNEIDVISLKDINDKILIGTNRFEKEKSKFNLINGENDGYDQPFNKSCQNEKNFKALLVNNYSEKNLNNFLTTQNEENKNDDVASSFINLSINENKREQGNNSFIKKRSKFEINDTNKFYKKNHYFTKMKLGENFKCKEIGSIYSNKYLVNRDKNENDAKKDKQNIYRYDNYIADEKSQNVTCGRLKKSNSWNAKLESLKKDLKFNKTYITSKEKTNNISMLNFASNEKFPAVFNVYKEKKERNNAKVTFNNINFQNDKGNLYKSSTKIPPKPERIKVSLFTGDDTENKKNVIFSKDVMNNKINISIPGKGYTNLQYKTPKTENPEQNEVKELKSTGGSYQTHEKEHKKEIVKRHSKIKIDEKFFTSSNYIKKEKEIDLSNFKKEDNVKEKDKIKIDIFQNLFTEDFNENMTDQLGFNRLKFQSKKSSFKEIKVNNKYMKILALIGKGGSGRVYQVLFGTEIYALKRIRTDETEISHHLNEINILQKLNKTEGFIKLIDYECNEDELLILMEYGETDLYQIMKKELSLRAIQYFWEQIVNIIKTLHEHAIVHRDLKPANFLIVKGRLKLIDFGISRAYADTIQTVVTKHQIGTLNYMAPEALGMDKSKLGKSTDVWSLGCILYEMIYGKSFLSNFENINQKILFLNEEKEIDFAEKPRYESAIAVAKKCLRKNSEQRVTLNELSKSLFLSGNISIGKEHIQMLVKKLLDLGKNVMDQEVDSKKISELFVEYINNL